MHFYCVNVLKSLMLGIFTGGGVATAIGAGETWTHTVLRTNRRWRYRHLCRGGKQWTKYRPLETGFLLHVRNSVRSTGTTTSCDDLVN